MSFVGVAAVTGAAVGLTQLGMGIGKSVKAKKEAAKAEAAQKRALEPLNQAVDETRQMKNVTQGAGMAQAQAQARQSQADTIGLSQQQTADSSKLAAIAGQTNLQALKAGQQRDAITEQQRLQGQQMHVSALSNQAAGRVGRANQMQQQAQNIGTEASNLMGAGLGNIVGSVQGIAQMNAYAQIESGTYKSFMFGGKDGGRVNRSLNPGEQRSNQTQQFWNPETGRMETINR
jgi:hypothetical protein